MAGRKPNGNASQRRLDFETAERAEKEQRKHRDSRLRSVLKRVKGDLYMWQLLQIVAKHESPQYGCVRSYAALADLLWCDDRTAKRKVATLERAGFLTVLPRRGRYGEQDHNEYRVNWSAVDGAFESYFGVTVAETGDQKTEAVAECQPDTTLCHTVTTQCQRVTHIKERNLLEISQKEIPAGERPAAEVFHSASEQGNPSAGACSARWEAIARGRLALRLQSFQYDRVDELLAEAEEKFAAEEFERLLDEFAANRAKFAGPGAIASRVRKGCWPVAGIRSAAELAAVAESKAERDAVRARESRRWELHEQRKQIARACGGLTEAYYARCRRELPTWFVEEVCERP